MSNSEPAGCLTVILSLFGISLGGPAPRSDLPYRQRDDFLSAAELSFYRVLRNTLGDQALICPKVNLADLFFVVNPKENQAYRNKIDRKHVDFLLCDPAMMQPRCGVELDDSSHARRDRQERDEFVDQVFSAAGLPLVRVPAKAGYTPANLLELIEPHLNGSAAAKTAYSIPPTPVPPTAGTPSCPKCRVPMVQRVAKTGPNAGQKFLGCSNYPKCKEVTAVS